MSPRVLFVVSALFALAGFSSAQEGARLHKLCELWGGIKYFHPKLAYADIDWDQALVGAIPKVRAAKTSGEYRAAISEMLGKLEDPGSVVASSSNAAPVKPRTLGPKFRMEGDVLVFDLASSIDTIFGAGYNKLTEDVKKALGSAKGLVIDARARGLGGLETFRVEISLITYAHLGLSGIVASASSRTRQHLGYVPIRGTTSGGYSSSLNTAIPSVVEGFQTKPLPFVVLIDASTPPEVYPLLAGAQAAGQCAVVAESANAIESALVQTTFDMGEGVSVSFPTAEIVSADGYVGFQPDKIVPPNDKESALSEALALAKHTIKKRSAGKAGVLPPRPLLERSHADMLYPSTEYRLLALFRYWNVIRYFFPYLNLTGRDWGDVLDEFIPKLIEAKDASDYGRTVGDLGAQIRDSHGTVTGSQVNLLIYDGYPALRTRFLEGKFIVSTLSEAIKAKGISQGDELVEVDGVSPRDRVEEQAKHIAISRPETAVYSLLPVAGLKGSVGKFKIRCADGVVRDIEAVRDNVPPTILVKPRAVLPAFGVLPSGYGYIDLSRVQFSDIEPSLAAVKDTPGLIFDMRGYPNATGWGYGGRLTSKPVTIARFLKPDPQVWSPTTGSSGGRLFMDSIEAAAGEKYKGKVVVLINHQAMSQAEHTCLILKAARPDIVFIGQPTVGANGDVTNVVLPGGISMSFSGQSVAWPDGKQLQRVGVLPDIKAEPTIKGTFEGRDDILEAAIAYLGRS